MKDPYLFQDDYLGISENKIHLLRNRFEYDSFSFEEIDSVVLKKGRAIKNWIALLVFGAVFLSLGIYFGVGVILFFISDAVGSIDIVEVIFPLFMILIGSYSIYESFKKEDILNFKMGERNFNFSINQFVKQKIFPKVKAHLEEKSTFENELN